LGLVGDGRHRAIAGLVDGARIAGFWFDARRQIAAACFPQLFELPECPQRSLARARLVG
jgi:hypothetical protein